VSGRDADLAAFVLAVAAYTAPVGGRDPVEVLAGFVADARQLAHGYYLDQTPGLEDVDEDEDVRMCAACEVQPAARDDRYCEACGTASDREAWADPPPAPRVPATCPAVLMVPLEVGRVSHICTRPLGHDGDHRSSLSAPNVRLLAPVSPARRWRS